MTSQGKQWVWVAIIVAGLGLGAGALVAFGPKVEGVDVGRRVPDYRTVRLGTEDSVSLRRLADGRVTLVNIWATWCVPCRAEMPAMEQLYREFGPKGFQIIAVSIDEGNPDDVASFVKELGITFDILHDKTADIQRVFQTTGVPESFLLDRKGVIVNKRIGEHSWNSPSSKRLVAELLGGD
jgi:cytochrome c biogenesis protein CcmG, thiol:disulfide interchange protein DsbE